MNAYEEALFESAVAAARRWHDFARFCRRHNEPNAAYRATENARFHIRRARIFRSDDNAH